jgi:hypothetical protein
MKQKKTKRRNLAPLITIGAGLLLIFGALAWLVFASTRDGSEPAGSQEQTGEEIPYPEVPRVGLGDAKAAYDLESAVFVDVRGPQAFAQAHIPGAVSLPLTELPQRLGELDPEDWIIPY